MTTEGKVPQILEMGCFPSWRVLDSFKPALSMQVIGTGTPEFWVLSHDLRRHI